MPSAKPNRAVIEAQVATQAVRGLDDELDQDLLTAGRQDEKEAEKNEAVRDAERRINPAAALALASMGVIGSNGFNLPKEAQLQNLNPTSIVRTVTPEKQDAVLDLKGAVPTLTFEPKPTEEPNPESFDRLTPDPNDLKVNTARQDLHAFDYEKGLGKADYAAFVAMKTPKSSDVKWPEYRKVPDVLTLNNGQLEITIPPAERESILGFHYGGVLDGVRRYAESNPDRLRSRNLERVLDQDFPAPVMVD